MMAHPVEAERLDELPHRHRGFTVDRIYSEGRVEGQAVPTEGKRIGPEPVLHVLLHVHAGSAKCTKLAVDRMGSVVPVRPTEVLPDDLFTIAEVLPRRSVREKTRVHRPKSKPGPRRRGSALHDPRCGDIQGMDGGAID